MLSSRLPIEQSRTGAAFFLILHMCVGRPLECKVLLVIYLATMCTRHGGKLLELLFGEDMAGPSKFPTKSQRIFLCPAEQERMLPVGWQGWSLDREFTFASQGGASMIHERFLEGLKAPSLVWGIPPFADPWHVSFAQRCQECKPAPSFTCISFDLRGYLPLPSWCGSSSP